MGEADIKARIAYCTEAIIRNQKLESEWNDKMLEAQDRVEFEDILTNRSTAIRGFYVENEACIKEIKSYITEPLSEEAAEALYEASRSMLLKGRMDPGLICEISTPAVRYFRENKAEDDRTIIISAIRCACMMDYYNRMIPKYHIDEMEENCLWIISHADRYSSYEDIRIRRNIWFSYGNLAMMYIQQHDDEYIKKAIDLYDSFKALWKRPDVHKLDGKNPEMNAIVDDFLYSISMEIGFGVRFDSDVLDLVLQRQQSYVEYHKSKKTDDYIIKLSLELLSIAHREYLREITPMESVEELYELMDSIPVPDWDNDPDMGVKLMLHASYVFQQIMRVMRNSSLPMEIREPNTIIALEKFRRIAEKVPYRYQTAYINALYKEMFSESLANLSSIRAIEQWIYHLLIYRQPSTYLHSRMVEEISLAIAEEILKKAPELFLELPGYNCVDDVLRDKKYLMEVIARGARWHDLGKCSIALVITQQSRGIVDDEFFCIKSHPSLGALFFADNDNKVLEPYLDIMRGHHKSYDGKSGYPYDFDNIASRYRIIIDLISISDSTDAATDITGRNYTPGKNFMTLLDELVKGAGTRYNPEIVRIIAESPELIERLTNLTGSERIAHCYEAYRNRN